MYGFSKLYHLMYADFLERARRYSYLLTLLFTIFVTYLFVPGLDAPFYLTLNLGGYRPIYNSAWVGSMVALLMLEFFPLFGFYLAKGTIENDLRTGVGAIIATTPMSKFTYALGKWLSHVAIFITMIGLIILASLALQLLRAEDTVIDLFALASPFVFVVLPAMMFVAALAVLFECVNWLRGGLGNILYFVFYVLIGGFTDFQGINVLWPSIYQSCAAHFSDCNTFRQIDLDATPLSRLPTFTYTGVAWSANLLISRLVWVIAAVLVTALAAVFFHRFDPSKAGSQSAATLTSRLKQALLSFVTVPEPEAAQDESAPAPVAAPRARVALSPLAPGTQKSWQLYAQLLAAELRLALKSVRWWWYLGAAALIIGALLVPFEATLTLMLPLAWLWPLLLWSALGTREMRYNTGLIVFSGPSPLQRQLPVTWMSGVLIAFAMAGGVLVRLALAGAWGSIAAVGVGALFVPTLALALGCLSGGSKLFEAVYLFLWYLAVVQSIPYLDFMGRFPAASALGLPGIYAGLTLLLLGFAVLGRRRQMRW